MVDFSLQMKRLRQGSTELAFVSGKYKPLLNLQYFKKIKERRLIQGDLEMSIEFLSIFYVKNLLILRVRLENFVDNMFLSFFCCLICAESNKEKC